jgi:sacsin
VHVNGFFELTTSRRDVWSDTSGVGSGRVRAEWNAALLRSVVAPCYKAVLAAVRGFECSADDYYALWPQTRPKEPWAQLVDELYARSPRTRSSQLSLT